MNQQAKLRDAFLCLLRQGLWNRKEDPEAYFPLTNEEWYGIYAWARKHAIQGLVYDGMLLLPVAFYPPKSLIIQWMTSVDQWERITKAQVQMLCGLQTLFNQEPSIRFELIKGLAIGCYYPQPFHRFSGDLDLYFGSAEKVEEANRRLESVGVGILRGVLHDSCYRINQIEVENHPVLIELHNPFILKKLRRWEQEVFGTAKLEECPVYGGQAIGVPVPVAHHILVSTHILKHLLDEGVGLRQLCDAAVLLKALHASTDAEELEKRCRQFGVLRWSKVLYALLVKYLGLPEEYLPFPATLNPDALMDEIWLSGNFGFTDERKKERPEGKWQNKWYTVRQITRKARLVFRYAPAETFWWPATLSAVRIKELFTTYESTHSKNNS